MQKRSDSSDVQKGMIIGFRAKGGSISETAEFVNCSRAAVVKVYRAWQNGTVQNQRRGKCGAPRAIDDRGERRLRRCVRADRWATVEQLTTKMNQGATKSVSQTTIQRTLLRLGLRSRHLVRAPMLTAVHRRRRLEFARQYSSWTSTEWRQVEFSDESRFMLHRTDGRWRIRRETSERNHPATIAGTVRAGGGSIMVWGMFSWHSLGFTDHCGRHDGSIQDDGIFQQDNARCHTAASVRAWFEEHQDEFTVLPWPANSPDLNPIEHLRLKCQKISQNLKKKRTAVRSSLTKLINKIEGKINNENEPVDKFEAFIEQLNDKESNLSLLNTLIEDRLSVDTITEDMEASEEIKEKIIFWKTKLSSKIRRINSDSILVDTVSRYIQVIDSNSFECMNINLPKLHINKYSGNYSEWLDFYNLFESSIHNNNRLSKVDKFNYLKSYLCGNALACINGFPISDDNYDRALDL
ncbi:transposable element Tcb1 transposase [Trichonephila clavipes]|nr:transposable element Tcb1 transposase [Trichonephila clavipes]